MTAAPTVVVTYPGFDVGDPATAGRLRAAGFEVRLEPRNGERTPEQVIAFMADATAGIVSTDPFDAEVFAHCPRLRVLGRVGVGVDTIDVDAATRAGVAVTTTPKVNANTVADHTLALLLACRRRLLENDAAVRAGRWDRGGALTGHDMMGAVVGVIGLGAIGRGVVRRLSGFDVEVLGSDVGVTRCDGVKVVSLDELLRASDMVTLHVPLAESTRGLIGAAELQRMRPGAILVNTARGGVVDQDALVASLRAQHLAAVGLDVFASEPPVGSPLLDLPNVVLSPHIAGISVGAQRQMLRMVVDSVLDVLTGRRPVGLVNPEAVAAWQSASIQASS